MINQTASAIADADFQRWKQQNPDWPDCLESRPSSQNFDYVHQRRKQIYQVIAGFPVSALQRMLNAKRLPPNPARGHWEEYFISEAMTLSQHAAGQYLPFHHEMEDHLARVFEIIDSHFGYTAADTASALKEHVEQWFDTHVRQPAAQAWGRR